MKKLNIVYVGMLPPHPGGSGISWSLLLAGLERSGHRIRAIAPITPDDLDAGDDFSRNHPQLNVHRYVVPYHYTGPNIPAPPEYIQLEKENINRLLGEQITADKPDVIIIGRESFVRHVPDIAIGWGIPTMLGIRGNTTMALVREKYSPDLMKEYLEQYEKTDLMVSVAKHMAEGLKPFGFRDVKVIENAVDTEFFRPANKSPCLMRQLELRDKQIVIAHVSNLKAAKRPLDIIESAIQVTEKQPDVVYLIIGDGLLREEMEATCDRAAISKRVRFTGWVSYARMPDYLRLADIVISASETEGLSRVYLEAQATGKLLLASDIAPAKEVIRDGSNGLLFEKGNVADLTRKTLFAVHNEALRKDIGDRARLEVQRFSLNRAVESYEFLLNQLTNKREPAS